MQIKPLNDYWVVVAPDGTTRRHWIAPIRSNAISGVTKNTGLQWRHFYNLGYRCVKVDINFTVKE